MANDFKKIALFFLVFGFCVGLDQVAKVAAQNFLATSPPIFFAGGIFRLQYAENLGAFMGFGANLPELARLWLLTIFPGVFLNGLLVWVILRPMVSLTKLSPYVLIVGGGASNNFDRLFNNGRVVDFMNMDFGVFHTGIFNLADVMLMVGIVTLILRNLYSSTGSAEKAKIRQAHQQKRSAGDILS